MCDLMVLAFHDGRHARLHIRDGEFKTGRRLRMREETRVSKLWVAMLERIDVRTPLGDSTGALKALAG